MSHAERAVLVASVLRASIYLVGFFLASGGTLMTRLALFAPFGVAVLFAFGLTDWVALVAVPVAVLLTERLVTLAGYERARVK